MILLCVIAMAMVPYFIGRAIFETKWFAYHNKNLGMCYILGFLACLLMGEVLHVLAVFLCWSIAKFSVLYGIGIGIMVLSAGSIFVIKKVKFTFTMERFWVLFSFLVILQAGLFIFLGQLDMQYDLILEEVSTNLYTNSFFTINPMTGQGYELGIPMRIRILGFSSILTALCTWFSLSATTVVTVLVPCFVLMMSYFVYHQWACYLFCENKKQRYYFMIVLWIITMFGHYATFMPSYGLFFMGYRPEVIVQNIICPFVILMTLQKRYWLVILCCMVEVFLVWTFYGLGISVFWSGIIIMVQIIKAQIKCRGRKTC